MRAPDFWTAGQGGLRAGALAPLGWLYGQITAARAARSPDWTAPVPVLCVGNVVMGGAGKTLVGLDMAARLQAAGRRPHILLRGYGGRLSGPLRVEPDGHTAADVGDEALLAAAAAPTWIGADRVASARAAIAAGADILILDDGLQNPALAKSTGILVLDGTYGLGNGLCFPAGPLREPAAAALGRCAAVVVIGGDAPAWTGGTPSFRADIEPAAAAPALAGRDVIAFAGIGRPEKFFATLRAAGAHVLREVAFADHHPYRSADIAPLIAEAAERGALLVTTSKDHVRLPAALKADVHAYPVGLRWQDDAAFSAFLVRCSALE